MYASFGLLFVTTSQRFCRSERFCVARNAAPEIGCSARKGKCSCFDIHERSPQRADASVKVSRFCLLQIDKKAPEPGSEIFREEFAISTGRSCNIATDKTRHDLTEHSDVILGFRTPGRPGNAETLKRLAQPREWTSVE